MSISPQHAADALADIDATIQRTQLSRSYRAGGPVLMMWGLLWAAGYLVMAWLPGSQWGLAWFALSAIGMAGSLAMLRGQSLPGAGRGVGLRLVSFGLACTVFMTCVTLVTQPADPAAVMALPGLFIGLIYGVVGSLGPRRYLWVGAYVFVLTLVGFFVFKPFLPYWMAAASLGLLLGGVWLMRD
ncbi:hypothetical protein [Pelomonas cellulosilytica]|uniref:DUF4401 domain-containing protein n=1 Tax=Pelomonas cellulosilytica TaxID=2906762 RepID=A0ABS8XV85_9BURK|nr:hypothetical protein [Pelomonas sp. P8]MCE4555205.1 hypothetical protein [Pelomonas sp. P8]